jgi:hypothetical protein
MIDATCVSKDDILILAEHESTVSTFHGAYVRVLDIRANQLFVKIPTGDSIRQYGSDCLITTEKIRTFTEWVPLERFCSLKYVAFSEPSAEVNDMFDEFMSA